MREALSGLTLRGRAFLAAGLTALACAVLLGQPALLRVAVLVLALPLVTAWVVGRSRYRLSLLRSVSPALVPAGQPARVELNLANEGRPPRGVLLLEDRVPYVLGTRPRFVLEGVGQRWRKQVTYQVRSEVRGRFVLGPMSVRVADPFGLVELGRTFQSTAAVVVTPRVVPLPAITLGGSWSGSGDRRPRAFASGSAEDVTVRTYRRGDDLRRVHWRSSARVGELMVRREEQPWQARATVLVDNRAAVHRGQGLASSLETAVTASASIAVHLAQRGYHVRLVTADGEDPATTWHDRDADTDTRPLLEALAVLEPTTRPTIDTAWASDHGHGLTVAVLGAVDHAELPTLRRLLHSPGGALALALDVEGWVRAGGRREQAPRADLLPAAGWLAQQGWQVATLGPTDRVEEVWEQLGASRYAGMRTPGAGAAAAVGAAPVPPSGVTGVDGPGSPGVGA